MAPHRAHQAPRERTPGEREGTVAVAEAHQHRGDCGAGRRDGHHLAKAAEEGEHQVRRRLAHGERPDHGADRQPARRAEPGGDHLHGRRVDAGQEEAGEEAEGQGRLVAGGDDDGGVGQGPEGCGGGEVGAVRQDVGQVERGGHGGARHEADLDGGGEPAGLGRRKPPERGQLGRDGAGGEPEGHPQQLGAAEEQEDPPPGRSAFGLRLFGPIPGRRVRRRVV